MVLIVIWNGGIAWTESKSGPRLSLTEFKVKQCPFQVDNVRLSCPFIYVNFDNIPLGTSESEIAKEVQARVLFQSKGRLPFDAFCRWAHNESPANRTALQSTADLDKTNIGIGDKVQLDIAFKYISANECYPWTNRSFHFPGGRVPEWAMQDGLITAEIYLMGIGVRGRWQIKFKNLGKERGFEPLTIERVRWKNPPMQSVPHKVVNHFR